MDAIDDSMIEEDIIEEEYGDLRMWKLAKEHWFGLQSDRIYRK